MGKPDFASGPTPHGCGDFQVRLKTVGEEGDTIKQLVSMVTVARPVPPIQTLLTCDAVLMSLCR